MQIKISIAVLYFIAILFWVSCDNKTSDGKASRNSTEQSTSLYQCPMDCEKGKTYDKAGQWPN